MIAGFKINDPHWFWPAYVFGVRVPVFRQAQVRVDVGNTVFSMRSKSGPFSFLARIFWTQC